MIDFKKKKFEGNYGNDEEYKKLLADYTKTIQKEATELIVEHQDLFTDYEVVKGGMDDVFLAVTGKKLGGER